MSKLTDEFAHLRDVFVKDEAAFEAWLKAEFNKLSPYFTQAENWVKKEATAAVDEVKAIAENVVGFVEAKSDETK